MDTNFQNEVRQKFNEYDSFKEDTYQFQDKMHKFQDEMYAFKNEMYEFKDETTQKLDNLTNTLNEVRNIVLLIEHDLHDRTSALFDAYSANNDEHQVINTRLCDLENLTLKNSAKISILEETTRYTL